MTIKQLHDIAAYWGAPCSFAPSDELYNYSPLSVNERTSATTSESSTAKVDVSVMMQVSDASCPTFKLHLRALASLTSKELEDLVVLAGGTHIQYYYPQKDGRACRFRDMSGKDNVLRIWATQQLNVTIAENPVSLPACVAYLQSRCIYVPGMIDEELVELMPVSKADSVEDDIRTGWN